MLFSGKAAFDLFFFVNSVRVRRLFFQPFIDTVSPIYMLACVCMEPPGQDLRYPVEYSQGSDPCPFIVDAHFYDPVFLKLDLLIRSIAPTVNHDAELERRMSSYVQQEEQQMERNLKAVAFNINDQNTLSLQVISKV